MIKNLLSICLLALACLSTNAQDFWNEYFAKGIDVEGVKVEQKMNYDQFVAKFGKPDEYIKQEGTEEMCFDEHYRIGHCYLDFRNDGIFSSFTLGDSHFAALTSWIPGGIRVGDKLSKLDNFKYGKPIVASWIKPRNGFVEYALFYNYLDDIVYLTVKDGIIFRISYSAPV
ncbi:MAG TPA: hypothetical protein DDX40_03495 [Rikenellaceae bacterium]|nr:hypothetical protein [Rikenellaceae bacterium]